MSYKQNSDATLIGNRNVESCTCTVASILGQFRRVHGISGSGHLEGVCCTDNLSSDLLVPVDEVAWATVNHGSNP